MFPPVEGNISPPVFFSPGGDVEAPQSMQHILRMAIPSFLSKLQEAQAMPTPEKMHRHKKVQHLKNEQILSRLVAQMTTIAAQAIQSTQTQKMPEQQPDLGKQKSPETQRDETKAKGKEGVGEDIVNIQVFAGEKGAQKESQSGTKENLYAKQEIPVKPEPKTKEQPQIPQTVLPAKEKTPETAPQIPKEKISPNEPGREAEKPKNEKLIEKEATSKSSVREPEAKTIETQNKDPNVAQTVRVMSENEKDKPERAAEKGKEREKVEDVQSEDKYRAVEHPRGHRVMEHGRAELRQRDDVQQQQSSGGEAHRHMNKDLIAPIFSGWYLPSFNREEEQGQGKAGSQKISRQMQEQNLGNLLFMIFTATQEGAKTIAEVVDYIESRSKWFTGILGLRKGMPSRQLIWWLLVVLDPKMHHQIVVPWLHELQGKSSGKAVLPFISVWETPIGLLFGQERRGEESIDKFAAPQLLKALDLSHAVVMSQMVNPEAQSSNHIERKGGEYLLELDETFGSAYENVRKQIEAGIQDKSIRTFESYIEGQERIIVQTLKVQSDKNHVFGTKTNHVVKVVLETPALVGVHAQRRYYASSVRQVEHILFDMLRVQSQVENKVEWLLNAAFQLTSFDAAMRQCNENLMLFGQSRSSI